MSNATTDPGTVSNGGEGYDTSACPLWNFVTITTPAKKGDEGNCAFKCHFFNGEFTGSHYRVKLHLLKIKRKGIRICKSIPDDKKREIQRLIEEADTRKKKSQPRLVPLPSSSSAVDGTSNGSTYGLDLMEEVVDVSKKRKGVTRPLDRAFNNSAKEALDGEIVRMFFTGGLSFNFAKNPHYIRAFNMACGRPIAGYRPPSYNALRTTLLHKERVNVDCQLEPIKHSWQQKCVSVCSDGWSDSQRRPLINIMAACESKAMFLKAVNCEGESKDKHFIADLLIESILDIGPQHVVQVITDNASSCKAARAIVNARFPHIFWTPCVVHTLNLALKNICTPSSTLANKDIYDTCNWITNVADEWFIKNFIMNHSMRLTMFNEHSNLKMLSIFDTRFASIVVMLKRFRKIKQGLEMMVISDQWYAYRDDDVGKARAMKDMILNDDTRRKIDYILAFTLPIYEMLWWSDTDEPCL